MTDPLINFSGKRHLPVVTASEAAECGLCCMAMIAIYHGHNVDLNGLRQHFSLSISGASLRSIIGLADALGFGTRALRVDLEELSKVKTPAILHWDLNHFVVLKKATRKGATIHDPTHGVRTLSWGETSRHFTGVVLELSPTEDFKPIKAEQKTRLRSLWTRLEGFWPSMAQVLVLSIGLQVAVFAAPFYLQLTTDQAIQTSDQDLLTVLALGFGALLAIQVALTALRSWALQAIGQLMGYQMTGNLVRHLLRLPVSYFEKRHVGDILSRLQSVRPIRDAITAGVITSVIDGVMAIIAAIILFVYSLTLALVVLGGLILTVALTLALYPFQRERLAEQIIASAKEQTNLVESVRAAATIRLMGREAEREAAWRNQFADVTNAGFSIGKYQIGMNAAQTLLTGLVSILVVYLAARMILAGDGFSVGMLFAFMSYRQTLSNRMLALINQVIEFRYLTLHLERVGDIVHAEREDRGDQLMTDIEPDGEISLSNVTFSYGAADRNVLQNISLSIAPGESVALIGASGGGKTTLFKLMLGLYSPTDGEILLDGKRASPQLWRSWRAHVGVVAQNDQLLSGTLADNIAFFDPDLDMARIKQAAMRARVHEDIQRMPMQYLSLVGDMGSALSGGQRQRVLLARALYRQPKLLFLDEGTANLDPKTEVEIADLIKSLKITRVVVAHRPALIQRADTVYELGGGKVTRVPKETLVQLDPVPHS